MDGARWFRPPQHVLTVFLGTMCLLAGALAWLCWQVLEQDRQLESQRVQDRLEQAADRASGILAARIEEFDRWLPLALAGDKQSPPDDVTLLLHTEKGVTVQPGGRLLYLPPAEPTGKSNDAAFAVGERSEFQLRDPAGAIAFFKALTTSPQAEIRAGALLRLGRNLRKAGRHEEALGAYEELLRLKNVTIEGVPADLMAMNAKCGVLETMGRREELRREASAMDAGLRSGRWSLPGAAWDFHRQAAARWSGAGGLDEREQQALALSRAAERICRLGLQPAEPSGHRIVAYEKRPVLISWTTSAGRVAAVLAGPAALNAAWHQEPVDRGVRFALADLDGGVVVGYAGKNSRRAVRSPAATGLAATLLVTPGDPAADAANNAIHRRFLLAVFATLGLILIAGSGFILHAMGRERAAARLQSEFVSAVSHEFRTPLTSMRQLSEMLVHDRIPGELERRQSYEVMFHASERLQRLVESLLDFGRMEAAAFQYRFEEVDVRAAVDRVVEEFRAQGAQGHEIELRHEENLPAIRADREAIGVAIWNLLDNAVKYSPESPTVWVETKRDGEGVAIVVRDRGVGIDVREQRLVFDRFVRGAAAQRSNTKGTGIGLSMARHIVQAHGGDIRIASEPGNGSTFTIALPAGRQG